MNLIIILFIFSSLFLSSCVQTPAFKGDEYAVITSNYPVVKVNDVEIEDTYTLDIEAGENTLVIVYNAYRYDYFCTFSWAAIAGTVYEVTDQENQYPLTLYRWVRTNGLWANRLDPVDPLTCTVVSREDDAS